MKRREKHFFTYKEYLAKSIFHYWIIILFSVKKKFLHKNKSTITQKCISLCSEEVKWQNHHMILGEDTGWPRNLIAILWQVIK